MDDSSTLNSIAHGLDRWYSLLGRQFGPLSRPQRRVLAVVAERSETRVGELADYLGMTTAGATRMIDTLEGLGYIRRFRLPDVDQRQVYLDITPAGHEALQRANQVFEERVQETIRHLSRQERIHLATLIAAITADAAAQRSP